MRTLNLGYISMPQAEVDFCGRSRHILARNYWADAHGACLLQPSSVILALPQNLNIHLQIDKEKGAAVLDANECILKSYLEGDNL